MENAMKFSKWLQRGPITPCLLALLLTPLAQAQAQSNQNAASESTQSGPPDNPQPQNNAQAQTPASQSAVNQQENAPAQPVGTAAAPAEKSLGVAASRPAGAVIAPGKQRRARSFVIRIGIVVGACIAVGTVVALSHASPSQPH
jgi:cobalamin biosynthesis Mg chelatase CobN